MKYVTIFFVLWGHVVQQSCMLKNPNIDYLFRTIYTFHMPLFMGICGYFFAISINKYGRKKYIKEKLLTRLKSLIIPMLSFGIIKILILQNFSLWAYLKAAHDVWFLGDLAINTIIILLVHRRCKGTLSSDWKFFLCGLPLASVPKIGYGGNGLFMYVFFVLGYISFMYFNDYAFLFKYWKECLAVYIISFILFDCMPYEPNSFSINFYKYDFGELLVVDSLKLVLGIAGCYLMLLLVYRLFPFFKNSMFGRRAIKQGRYTLDIYLLNIIILEMICGPLYRRMVMEYSFNLFYKYGLLFEIITTFICTCLIMELIVMVSKLMNKNCYIAKLFFYRSAEK